VLTLVLSQVKAGSNPVGVSINGLAQERLTNKHWWDGTPEPDEDWVPTTPGTQFYMTGGRINDWCGVDDALWASIPIGTVIWSYHQDLRIVFSMRCQDGNVYTFPASLGGWNVSYTKDTANTYTISIGSWTHEETNHTWRRDRRLGDRDERNHVDGIGG
jgi:hypothetical protein